MRDAPGLTMSSDSDSHRTSLSLPDIEMLEDVVDAIELCDEHDIPIDDLNSMDDFIERIRLHMAKTKTAVSRKREIEESILKAGKDDEHTRRKLTQMMKEMVGIRKKQGARNRHTLDRQNSYEFMEGLLKTEGTTSDLAEDCAKQVADIESGECCILVAGETSAGKSSVLNLLFEQDILPVHTKSSTSVITIVRYGRKPQAKVVYKSDHPEKTFDLDKDGLSQFQAIAFMDNASEREFHNIKEVQVFLPLQLLKSGLVLVDSPGIGENEFLEAELMNFISKTHIMGFIYIIKTDNAGGVQEDRLLNLLKLVVSNQRQRNSQMIGLNKFDPKAALFVCNRFDLVECSERENVRQNAIDKLSACWPSFDETQVVFFSTDKALRDVQADADYINDNYKELLDGLRDLYIAALEKRIKNSYKWLENVLKRSVHHLKSMVKRLDFSDRELKEKSSSAKSKLEALQQKADSVLDRLTTTVDECEVSLREELRTFICSEACRKKLTTEWGINELPNIASGLGDWQWVKSKIHELFYDKLGKLVTEWDEEEEKIDVIEKEISGDIKFELRLLEHELSQIEKEIQDDGSSNSDDEIAKLCKRRQSRSSSIIPLPNRSRFLITEPKLPLRLAGRLILPIKSVFDRFRSQSRVEDFKKDPVKVATEKALELYYDLLKQTDEKDCGLLPYVEYLLERPREYIQALERKIPSLILSNQLLVNHFEQSITVERAHQKEYVDMMTDIENLRRSLMEYGEGYIFVDDFMKGEIQVQQVTPEGGNVSVAFKVSDFLSQGSSQSDIVRKRDIRGLWTITYSGVLLRNSIARPIGIRVYLPSSGMQYTFNEVAKLRCLTYGGTNLAEFLGIHHADAPTPAFVYDGHLKSVRRFLMSPFLMKRTVIPEILEDTAVALEYLHNKGLVHMELTTDTVTVNENGVVSLTGACLPRVAKLPSDPEHIQAGDFVYLAPEVLNGEVYTASADIYSFGLFLLELIVPAIGQCVFKTQKKMSLFDFMKTVDPETMMNLEELVQIFTIKTRALIQSCLSVDKKERPGITEMAEYTMLVKDEEALAQIPTRRSRGQVKKRHSETKISFERSPDSDSSS